MEDLQNKSSTSDTSTATAKAKQQQTIAVPPFPSPPVHIASTNTNEREMPRKTGGCLNDTEKDANPIQCTATDTVTAHNKPAHIKLLPMRNQLPLKNLMVVYLDTVALKIQKFFSSKNKSQLPAALPQGEEECLVKFFEQLDRYGIDICSLSEELRRKLCLSSIYVKKKNHSVEVSFPGILSYKKFRVELSDIDNNNKFDLEELRSAFKDLDIKLGPHEAKVLLTRMAQNGRLHINFDDWCREDLMLLWRHSSHPDIGEDLSVPDDFTQDELQTGMWWRHLTAGAIAGAVSRTCTAPLDRIKVFLQVQRHKTAISDSLRYLLQEGGASSLWRGNGINVLKIAPESAIKFAAYEKFKRLIRGSDDRQLSIKERFVAGAGAGVISQTVIYPMEVLKTRLALRKTGQYAGIADAIKKIYFREGMHSFYRGYIPGMVGIIPFAGIDLAVYETLKKMFLNNQTNEEESSFLIPVACGSASSTLGQVCTYPLLLVRTRLQVNEMMTKADIPIKAIDGIVAENNMLGAFRTILKTEGIRGLYRGITPNFIKVLPAVSISYVIYEYSSRLLGVKMT